MRIFQLWLVLNSCVFMSFYFLTFLLLKYSRLQSALICTLATAVSIVFEICRIYFAFESLWPKIYVTIANILVLQVTAFLISEQKNSYTLFIGFSSSNFVLTGNISSCAVLLVSKNYIAAMAVCTIINAACFICMYVTIRDICTNVLSKEISIWMCLIPAMCYITFYFMLYFPVYFEQRPESMYAAFSLLITVIVMYILLLQYIYSKSNQKKLLWRNKELHAYIRGIELQAQTVESAIHDFQIMRHDMRHKDNLLIELLQDQKYNDAKQILSKDIEYLDRSYLTIYCENTVINSLLYGMANQAENLGIQLKLSCTVPKSQEIDNYDLAILTANLLENSIQSVTDLKKEERFVALTMKNRAGESFFLEIKNPCHKKVKFSKKTGLPLSDQGSGHGFGMVSVQEFADKYHAQFDCYIEEDTFIVRILINYAADISTKQSQ